MVVVREEARMSRNVLAECVGWSLRKGFVLVLAVEVVLASRRALVTVVRAAAQAVVLTSAPRIRMSLRPRMWVALAVTKARMTPEPVPTSRTSGLDEVGGKRDCRKLVSDDDERVSRKRKESSAGS